jgi:succinate-semialdehyde dehydrogenase/glutarate-semialdehyde dehydrogenase
MDDADLDLAAEAAVTACFLCAGQSCTAGERLLVHHAARDEFVAKLRERVQRVVLGNPFDESTVMGPLNNAGVAEKMDEHVADALERGATVIHGGSRADGFPTNLYWQPTVLDGVSPDALVAQEETFGPVAPVVEIASLDEAIRLANATRYGLQAGIFTTKLETALRAAQELEFGGVIVNEAPTFRADQMPYGGVKDSGNTREGPAYAVRELTEERLVVIDL